MASLPFVCLPSGNRRLDNLNIRRLLPFSTFLVRLKSPLDQNHELLMIGQAYTIQGLMVVHDPSYASSMYEPVKSRGLGRLFTPRHSAAHTFDLYHG